MTGRLRINGLSIWYPLRKLRKFQFGARCVFGLLVPYQGFFIGEALALGVCALSGLVVQYVL